MASMTPNDRPDLAGPGAAVALTRLYDSYAREIHRYLTRRLDTATADDLVAQTFLIAWEQRGDYRQDRASARAWLYGIATNLFRRHARSEIRALRAMERQGVAGDADPTALVAGRVDAARQAQRIAGAIAGLRDEERDVLLLVAWADLGPSEVADALGVKVATVRTRLHRARATLRGHLSKEDLDV